MAQPRRLSAHALDDRQEGVAGEERDGVGVVEDVGHLVGREAMIHRHREGADRPHGGRGQQHVERVVRVENDVLAGGEVEIAQRVGQTIAREVIVAPAQATLALDDGRRGGVKLGVARDCIHGSGARRS